MISRETLRYRHQGEDHRPFHDCVRQFPKYGVTLTSSHPVNHVNGVPLTSVVLIIIELHDWLHLLLNSELFVQGVVLPNSDRKAPYIRYLLERGSIETLRHLTP